MKKIIFIIAATLVSHAAPAQTEIAANAVAEVKSVDLSLCEESDSSFDVEVCYANSLKELDQELAAAHSDVIKAYTGVGIAFPEMLKEINSDSTSALKSFRSYRKSACTLNSAMWTGGTGRGRQILTCEAQMTEKRIVEIKKLAKEFRGH